MDNSRPKPIMHIEVDTHPLNAIMINRLSIAIQLMNKVYKDQYTIFTSPRDAGMNISTSDNNVVRLDLHDQETVEKFIEIIGNQGWRKEKEDVTSEGTDNMD